MQEKPRKHTAKQLSVCLTITAGHLVGSLLQNATYRSTAVTICC